MKKKIKRNLKKKIKNLNVKNYNVNLQMVC